MPDKEKMKMTKSSIINTLLASLLIYSTAFSKSAPPLTIEVDDEISSIFDIKQMGVSEMLKLTRPAVVEYYASKGWVCNLCVEIPSKESKTLRAKRYHKLKTQWELRKDVFWSDGTVTTKDLILQLMNYRIRVLK